MKKFSLVLFAILPFFLTILLFPVPILAAFGDAPGCVVSGDVPSLGCLADVVVSVINYAFMFLASITLIFLLFGAFKHVTSGGDAKAIESAHKTMNYALAGFFLVIFSFFLLNLVTTSLGLGNILTKFTFFQK